MTDEQEPVGSVGEEALKLLQALQGWAGEAGVESAAAEASSAFRSINEHIATSGRDCRYCPLCQVISAARSVSPEVKEHLGAAVASLVQAATAALATDVPPHREPRRPSSPVENIDLSDDPWDDD